MHPYEDHVHSVLHRQTAHPAHHQVDLAPQAVDSTLTIHDMTLKIAIVGAGPAGCMLARIILRKNPDISVTIFEGEGSIDFRSQGGSLDLHEKSGLKAMKEAGLWDEFLRYARYDGEALQLCDKNLLAYVRMSGGKPDQKSTGRPEIDRPRLRQILYESLPEGMVKWEHKITNVSSEGVLHFANQPDQSGFSLIVGADGAWSKVRPLITDVKPYYSGISGHAFRIPDAEKTQPELYKLTNRGSIFNWSDGKSITAQYMGDGSINIGTWLVRSEDWRETCGYDIHDAAATKEACCKDYADWHPKLVDFTQKAEDHVTPRDLYMLPLGHRWDHVPGVTLIGDAAHLMTPFAGEGVNLAFSDCIELAAAISKSTTPEDLDRNVKVFEEEMFVRMNKFMQLTSDMMTAMFMTPGAPRMCIERYLLRAMSDELGWLMTMVLTPVVYAYFAVFKMIW